MKIELNNCLQLSAVFLQLDNMLAIIENKAQELTDEERQAAEHELDLMIRCANLVIHEIAAEYFNLKTSEKLSSTNGKIPYTDFSRQPVDIYSVKKDNLPCRFKLYPSELITSSGDIEVFFTYMPDKIGLGGSLDFEEGKMNSRIIAYGTAAEYCIISGMYEEAALWDKRYKDSLHIATLSLKNIVIPQRRWQ